MAMFEVAPHKLIGGNHPCFIIAECGQNHQGDINIAMQMIHEAANNIKADCVKFQKSDLSRKFNAKALMRPYTSVHSWGSTYGEHKAHLEFTHEQFASLQKYAANEGILFSASAMDYNSLQFLCQMNVPFIKIGSGDVNNFPLLESAARQDKPIILSTGMHDIEVVKQAYDLIIPLNRRLALLHCVSSYPAPFGDINLRVLNEYKKCFSSAIIGYSGHEVGNEISIAAVTLGAKVLERHLTLDKTMKGTDHFASLEPIEFENLIKQIRNVETALSGSGLKKRCESELTCYQKLGKSIVASKHLPKNSILSVDCLDIKVAEPFGIEAHKIYEIIGRSLRRDIEYDESIQYEDLY